MPYAHVTLASRNPTRASRFFAATLGWKPVERPVNIDRPAAWLEIAPGQEIHIVEVVDFIPSPFEEEFGRHVAVFHPRRDFGALRERLIEHGAELIEPRRKTPFARFFFRTPDGYVFEVIEAAA